MPASTPIATTRSAALQRAQDAASKGHARYTSGSVAPAKAISLLHKFHDRYAIGATPAQRATRKAQGKANCCLVLYWPDYPQSQDQPGDTKIPWLLLATPGTDLEGEQLHDITDKPHLQFMGYELVRLVRNGQPSSSWTWRRPKQAMADLYTLLAQQLNARHHAAVEQTLATCAHQPGFHGVRQQTQELFRFARQRGYTRELPTLYYLSRISHGPRVPLPDPSGTGRH